MNLPHDFDFDFTDLRLFLSVVQAGSITHGATQANISLAAASERLRGMEETTGTQLLTRGARGVSPTPAGEALAHHARLILRQMEHLKGEMSEHVSGLKTVIPLLANTAAISEHLPARLGPWLARQPQINVDLKERSSAEIVTAVASSVADIGIISDAVECGALQTFPFATDHLVLVTPEGHPLAQSRSLTLSDALPYEFIGLTLESPLQRLLEGHALRAGGAFRQRARVTSFTAICQLVGDGAGLGIIPATAALRLTKSLPVCMVPLSDSWAMRQLLVCARELQKLPLAARDLVEHLKDQPAIHPRSAFAHERDRIRSDGA